MKKIITILLSLFSIDSFAQTDSSLMKVTVTIQARDCEYLGVYIAFNQDYEDLFDAMKAKFRVVNPPSGTTNVVVDTITIVQWLGVINQLQADPFAVGGSVFTRVDAALRAVNNEYLTRILNEKSVANTNIFMNMRVLGRNRLRKQNN